MSSEKTTIGNERGVVCYKKVAIHNACQALAIDKICCMFFQKHLFDTWKCCNSQSCKGFHVRRLFRLFVAGIAGTLPFARLEDLTDTLHCILSDTRPKGTQWLCEAIGMLPENLATNAEREKFAHVAKRAENEQSSR